MSKKLTTAEFIIKAKKVHGNKYDYNKTVYTNNKAKVIVICPIHGEFTVRASHHYNVNHPLGCRQCAITKSRLTTAEWVAQARKVHGDKYDYSNTVYIKSDSKVEIICKEHGSFYIVPIQHTSAKQGCAKCAGLAKSNTEEFIAKAREVYGDTYDYGLVKYEGNKRKVKVTCKLHGVFETRPNDHLMGKSGCPKCKKSRKLTHKEWVEKAITKHNGYYTYGKAQYITSLKKVVITCPVHRDFEQVASSHIAGQGCAKCNRLGTDADAVYIWKVIGFNDVYKVGITSAKLGSTRIDQVAKESGLKAEIVILAKVDNAYPIEAKLLDIGHPYKWDTYFNGSTEFRVLTQEELMKATTYIKDSMSLQRKINE